MFKVSFFILYYNYSDTTESLINSIQKHTLKIDKLLIVYDGSIDDLVNRCKG